MNIFFLDKLALVAASLHCDKHLVKMILESTQILYSVLSMLDILLPDTDFDDIEVKPYKPTHSHHPSVLWVLGGYSHFAWLLDLATQLCIRYSVVYGRTHKCEQHLAHIRNWVTELDLPGNCDVAGWLERLSEMSIPQKCIEACMGKVATVNPPSGCRFGVVCAESGDPDVPSETLRLRAGDDIDLVASYRTFYAFKSKRKFVMKWNKTNNVPPELAPFMQSFLSSESLLESAPKRVRDPETVSQPKKLAKRG